MKIIVPMAGMGKRMRPHTLTVPKPLIPVAGTPIVQRLVEDIVKVCGEKVDEIAFIISPAFGKKAEENLVNVAESLGAKGSIYYQVEALGTAHAVLCAEASLTGKVVVAFADTLFKADFQLDTTQEAIIWVNKVDDPKPFGVVKINEEGVITEFHEKPQEFISDLAIIGIYYFKDGDNLKTELQYLLDNDIKDKGEYQITNALENMKNKGLRFHPGTVTEWLDCGNKNATVYTNQRVLEFDRDKTDLVSADAVIINSVIIAPSFVGKGAHIKDSVIGPHASIGAGTKVVQSVISNSIVQEQTQISFSVLSNSLIGNSVIIEEKPRDLSLGDFSTQQ